MKNTELSNALYNCDERISFTEEELSKLVHLDIELSQIDNLINRNLENSLKFKNDEKINNKEFISTAKELINEREKLDRISSIIQLEAEHRFIETILKGSEELIFFDVRDRIKQFINKPVTEIINEELNSKLYIKGNESELFKRYVNSISYLTARMHFDYCDKHSLKECSKKIEEYIMQETRNKFKKEYNIEPTSDFCIVRYGRLFTEIRKPHERMLDPNKKFDTVVNYDFGDIALDFNTDKKLSVSGLKMIDFLLLKTNNPDMYKDGMFQIPLIDYMQLCDLSAQRNAKKQVINGLGNLFNLSITLKEEDKKNKLIIGKSRLISSFRVKNGFIFAESTNLFLYVIKKSKYMTLPNQLFRINALKNPYSYYFLKKISELKNMNINSSNEDIITIHKLLESCPTMPKYEDIKRSGAINQRIKDPLFRDLDALDETISYELITTSKEKISIEKAKELPFEEFECLRVHVSWKAYPDRRKTKIELS